MELTAKRRSVPMYGGFSVPENPESAFVKSPAFQIYPAEFLADGNTIVMNTTEIGAYCLLLFVCWRENGLPDNIDELAVLTRMSVKQFQSAWDKRIQRCFIKREDGRWTHKRLEKERLKQIENRKKRQAAGQKGAETRWQTDSNAMTENKRGRDSVIAPDSLSDCSLQSSDCGLQSSPSGKDKRPAKKQRDERATHPAMVAFREVKGRFPSKDVWDLVIQTLGDHPDVPKMRECWVAWRGHGYAPENLAWLVDWYVNGQPGNGARGQQSNGSMDAVRRVIAKYENEPDESRVS